MMMRTLLVLAFCAGVQAGNIKLNLRQKTEVSQEKTSTLAQTQALLKNVFAPSLTGVARNLAAREYFHHVFHMPTTHQKMQATESFLASAGQFEASLGRAPSVPSRLTPNELEHWLTTEFFPQDMRDSAKSLAYLYPGVQVPPGLISRGAGFSAFYKNMTGCVTDLTRNGVADKKIQLNYGTSCGDTSAAGSSQGCAPVNRRLMRIQNDDVNVCADGGTDACCAQHDMIRTGININQFATISSCKANSELTKCLKATTPSHVFYDKRNVAETEANSAAQCLYSIMPCLAKTANRYYEIDFKATKAPMVRSLYPKADDHHVQVVFPWDKSYGEDQTNFNTIWRKSWKAPFEYSHWKHIDPPAEVNSDSLLVHQSTWIDQPIGNMLAQSNN